MSVLIGIFFMILPVLLFTLIFRFIGVLLKLIIGSGQKDTQKKKLDDFFKENVRQYHQQKDKRRQMQDQLLEQFFGKSETTKSQKKNFHGRNKYGVQKAEKTFTYEIDHEADQKRKARIHREAWSTPLDSIFPEEDFATKVLQEEGKNQDGFDVDLDTDHLIQGLIYSEILDKPLSLR